MPNATPKKIDCFIAYVAVSPLSTIQGSLIVEQTTKAELKNLNNIVNWIRQDPDKDLSKHTIVPTALTIL